jgi:hypothetical protein
MSDTIQIFPVAPSLQVIQIATGARGIQGETGTAATIAVGTVTTLAAGEDATVANSGTSGTAVFDFGIPQGDQGIQGDAATIAVGTVTTLSPGASATVTNSGTTGAAVFDFGIPQGEQGDPGEGDMLAANNLSDLTNTATARSNLGVGDNFQNRSVAASSADLNDITTSGQFAKQFTAHTPSGSSQFLYLLVQAWSNGIGCYQIAVESGPSVWTRTNDGSTWTSWKKLTPSTDGTLAGNSDLVAPSEKAVKTYVDGTITSTALKQGKHTIWIPATAMVSRTTNGAAVGTAETTTNKNMIKTLDFDTSTQEFAQFTIAMPKSWNEGTVTFQPVWSHGSTVTNFGVVWALQGVATSDDDAMDAAFGTEQTSTDTGGTTDDRYIGPESSAITIAGTPAAGDVVQFQIKRNPSDASDTMAVDARLHGVKLYFTIDAATDA